MTKQAQTQLKLEIEKYYDKVRFCLICNYISKIERSLLSEFIIMRFSNLSKRKKEDILTNIVKNEHLNKSNEEINDILNLFSFPKNNQDLFGQQFFPWSISTFGFLILNVLFLEYFNYPTTLDF